MLRFIRTTLAGGLLFLVPLVVLVVLVEKPLIVADHIVEPVAAHLPIKSVIGLEAPKILAALLLVAVCFAVGLLARTAPARRLERQIESGILVNLPGYEFFKDIAEGLLGVEAPGERQVVLARFDDCSQLGFLQDTLQNGDRAVFLPDAPNPHSGTLIFMSADRVTLLDMTPQDALRCFKRLGTGSRDLLTTQPT